MTSRAEVLDALGTVYDPELDEPITHLGFVGACDVSPVGDVYVRLRLPTPQCAPTFAYLMTADAHAAVRHVAGGGEVRVVLDDHYTQEEINGAVAGTKGFEGAFPGESAGAPDLDALRNLFRRKALVARQTRVCQRLLAEGASPTEVVALAVRDLPADPDAERSIVLRRALGLPAHADAPAFVAGDGRPIPATELSRWLRRGQLIGLSLETNGGICRALLEVRHGVPDPTNIEVAS